MAAVSPSDLHLAVLAGDVKATKRLLRDGCDAAARDRLGRTPLQWAVTLGLEDITKALIVNTPRRFLHSSDRFGRNVLHYAAAQGRTDLLLVLIQRGGDVHSLDCLQKAPLHFAAAITDPSVAEILLEKGADASAVDANGLSPLDYAVRHGSLACEELLRSKMPAVVATVEEEHKSSGNTERLAHSPLAALDANSPISAKAPIRAAAPSSSAQRPLHDHRFAGNVSSCPSAVPVASSCTNKATPSSSLESLLAAWKSSCERSRLDSQATDTSNLSQSSGDFSSPSTISGSTTSNGTGSAGAAASAVVASSLVTASPRQACTAGAAGASAMEWSPSCDGSCSGVAGPCGMTGPCGLARQGSWHAAEQPGRTVCC